MRLAAHFPAVVLTGARQTGKTTLLRARFPDHHYVSLDLPSEAQLAEDSPEQFLQRHPAPLLVDEVQYAPGLFRHLKVEIDRARDENGRFVLTGSQKFGLMRGVSDSLAGRCGVAELEGLTLHELGDVYVGQLREHGIASILVRGFMPQLWKDLGTSPADYHRAYLATYLERDVRQILNVGSLRDFSRFMRAAAVRSGQLLNRSELAKEVGVSARTINQWLGVLEASNQVTLLEPWFANVGKRLVKSPKLYFNDVGLLCFLLGLTEASLPQSYLLGAIWETFCCAELRKWIEVGSPAARLWFYRDDSREVDFVVENAGALTLADAKWTEHPAARDFEQMAHVASRLRGVRTPMLVLSRTPTPFPVAQDRLAIGMADMRAAIPLGDA